MMEAIALHEGKITPIETPVVIVNVAVEEAMAMGAVKIDVHDKDERVDRPEAVIAPGDRPIIRVARSRLDGAISKG